MTDAEYRECMQEVEQVAELATSMSAAMCTHLKHNGWTWELEALLKELNRRIDHIYAEIATANDRQRSEQEPPADAVANERACEEGDKPRGEPREGEGGEPASLPSCFQNKGFMEYLLRQVYPPEKTKA